MSKKLSETLEIPADVKPAVNALTGSAYRDLVAAEDDWLLEEALEYGANNAARARIENAVNSNQDSPEKDKLLSFVPLPRSVSYEPGDSSLFVDPRDLAAAFPEVYSKFHEIDGQYHDLNVILRHYLSPELHKELQAHELRLLTQGKIYQTLLGTEIEPSSNQLFPEIENYRLQIRKKIILFLVFNAVFALLIRSGAFGEAAGMGALAIGGLDLIAIAEALVNTYVRAKLRRKPLSSEAEKIYDLAMEIHGLHKSDDSRELLVWKEMVLKRKILQLNGNWLSASHRQAIEAFVSTFAPSPESTKLSEAPELVRVKLNNRIAPADQSVSLPQAIEDDEEAPSTQTARRTR